MSPKGRTNTGVFIRCKEFASSRSKNPEFGERIYRAYRQYTDVNLDNPENQLINQTLWLTVPRCLENFAWYRRYFPLADISFGIIEIAANFSVRRTYKTQKRPLTWSCRCPFFQWYSLTREMGRQKIWAEGKISGTQRVNGSTQKIDL